MLGLNNQEGAGAFIYLLFKWRPLSGQVTISNILLPSPCRQRKHFSDPNTHQPPATSPTTNELFLVSFIILQLSFFDAFLVLVPPSRLLCIYLNVALSEVSKSSFCVDKYVGCLLLDDVVL